MKTKDLISRRYFLTGTAAAAALASRLPVEAQQTAAEPAGGRRARGQRPREEDSEKKALPVIAKKVEKAFLSPGQQPNGLQAMADGLWILDQRDPNKAHKVRWEDGSVIKEIQTEGMHSSGITFGNGALWIASTASTENCATCLKTMKVDPETGKTLALFDTPGAVPRRFGRPGRRRGEAPRPGGAHGMEWVDGAYWIAVPPSIMIYKVQPETGEVLHAIPAPGQRPHGLAWENGKLWCVESNDRAVYQMDPETGDLLAKIQLTEEDPTPHGLTIRDGVLWYCDAESRWVCRLV
jgi:streptogramin lyase